MVTQRRRASGDEMQGRKGSTEWQPVEPAESATLAVPECLPVG
ncbi:hypothetical protein BamMC406_5210 [Burkholderia ambifaria MC40-6]|uniref:Uncharacterized protein n=1 Tax=Burkholderia ambifaria (strain MC40-6) TaxID=398577 RepID=B1Z0V3_BURA4|nr:hypothetical protein BamMC406_5210 [Burkholderia ambifaria MC40-6]